jgi:hypothetical protein
MESDLSVSLGFGQRASSVTDHYDVLRVENVQEGGGGRGLTSLCHLQNAF